MTRKWRCFIIRRPNLESTKIVNWAMIPKSITSCAWWVKRSSHMATVLLWLMITQTKATLLLCFPCSWSVKRSSHTATGSSHTDTVLLLFMISQTLKPHGYSASLAHDQSNDLTTRLLCFSCSWSVNRFSHTATVLVLSVISETL